MRGRVGCTLVVVLVAALPEEHRLDHVCLRAAAPAVGLHAAAQRRPQPGVQRHAELGVERATGGARAIRAAARLLGVLAGQHVGHEGVALALREDRRDEEVPVLGVALALLARELHRGRTPKPPAQRRAPTPPLPAGSCQLGLHPSHPASAATRRPGAAPFPAALALHY